MLIPAPTGEDATASSNGFRVAGINNDPPPAMAKLQAALQSDKWEKAIAALDELDALEAPPLVSVRSGVLMPFPSYRRQLLMSLPPEGRRAFALFHEAKAKALLEAPAPNPRAEADNLQRVYDRFFITAAGAKAADRLADLAFEAGDFSRADRCWSDVIDRHPDPGLDMVRLRIKRATALARLGETSRLAAEVAALTDSHGVTRTRIAGRDVMIGQYLASLSQAASPTTRPASPGAGSVATVTRPRIPRVPVIRWRAPLLDEQSKQQLEATLSGRGGSIVDFRASPPVLSADDARIYLSWHGTAMALDRTTGKSLWQSGRPQEAASYYRGNRSQLPALTTTITPMGLLCSNPRMRGSGSQISLLDPATGAERWTTANDGAYNPGGITGPPLIDGDMMYLVALSGSMQELVLHATRISDGFRVFQVPLGSLPSNMMGMRGNASPRSPTASILDGSTLIVQTNAGAVLGIDVGQRRLAWAYVYESAGVVNAPTAGRMAIQRGTLVFKDVAADRVQWLRLSDLTPTASVEAEVGEFIIGSDDERVYTAGATLGAFSIVKPRRAWSTELLGTPISQAAVIGDSVFAQGAAGLGRIDAASGRLRDLWDRVDDREPTAGVAMPFGNDLIVISNDQILLLESGR